MTSSTWSFDPITPISSLPRIQRPFRFAIVAALMLLILMITTLGPTRQSILLHASKLRAIKPVESLLTTDIHMKHDISSRIAKVTMLYYDEPSEKTMAYENALSSHKRHDETFGYPHYVLRHSLVEGAWTKHAYLLSILVAEMQKAPSDRLDWLFWHDADVVLTNNQLPLEVFLPPPPTWSHINFIATNDHNGLNDGVFLLRVCEWSIHYMAAGLSWKKYKPKVDLRYDEQTALMLLGRDEEWRNRTIHVPQRWFNAYQDYGLDDSLPPEWQWGFASHTPGDLLVHLPGSGDFRTELIDDWLSKIRDAPQTYNVPLEDTTYNANITKFWNEDAVNDEPNQLVYWRRYHVIAEVGGKVDDARRKAVEEFKEENKHSLTETELDQAITELETKYKSDKIEAIRVKYDARASGKETDYTQAEVRISSFGSMIGWARALAKHWKPLHSASSLITNGFDEPSVLRSAGTDPDFEEWSDDSGQAVWDNIARPCECFDEPSRNQDSSAVQVKPNGLSFVPDCWASLDVCQNPLVADSHGFLVVPTTLVTAGVMIPVTSQAASSTFSDILFPFQWCESNILPNLDEYDISWTGKSDQLYWADSATGGVNQKHDLEKPDGQSHRHRFVEMMRQLAPKRVYRFLAQRSYGQWMHYGS